MNVLKWVSYTLILIGALNWSLVGAFGFDLVAFLFGDMSLISRSIYILVGMSALLNFILAYRDISECSSCNC